MVLVSSREALLVKIEKAPPREEPSRTSSLVERIRRAPPHTGGEFDAHLQGTADLLRAWGCRPELERAGRYHAVYGNPFGREPIASPERRELVGEIGVDAERLVQLWARVDRASIVRAAKRRRGETIELALAAGGTTTISAQELLDLCHLHAANRLEMASRTGRDCRDLDPLRPVLRAEAVAALDRQPRGSWLRASWRNLRARIRRFRKSRRI
jgi:hypothetical protein